jgi:hypothetical protein
MLQNLNIELATDHVYLGSNRSLIGQGKSGWVKSGAVDINRGKAMAYCDGLIDILSAFFNVSGRDIRSPKRQNLDVARVRQIGMYVANVVLGINMSMIGQGFGRNKSTVIHACHLIEDMRDDEEFDLLIARLEAITKAAFKFTLVEFETEAGQ